MSKKNSDKESPETFLDWLERQSVDDLISIAFDQHIQILSLEHLVQHLQTQTRSNAIDEYRDEHIKMMLQPDPWDGSLPSDRDIAEKAGVTARVVREVRNKSGHKKPKGRPKKSP